MVFEEALLHGVAAGVLIRVERLARILPLQRPAPVATLLHCAPFLDALCGGRVHRHSVLIQELECLQC